jgi:hypothetical protein
MNIAMAIFAAVAPGISYHPVVKGPPPPAAHPTLTLLAMGCVFVLIAAGVVSSLVTPARPSEPGRGTTPPKTK